MIGELIDALDHPDHGANVGWRVQTECRFSETPVTHGLVVGQQRLQQRTGTRHFPLLDTVFCWMALVVVIKRNQQGCLRLNPLAPFFLDQVFAELVGCLGQRDIQRGFQFVSHSCRGRRMRAGSVVMWELFHGAFHCNHFRNTTLPNPGCRKSRTD
nr:hypothetical protein [Pseudomonas sp. BF-R-12]